MMVRLSQIALFAMIPGLVYAGTYHSMAKEVHFVPASQAEGVMVEKTQSYDLFWNETLSKFESKIVKKGRSIIIEKPLPLLNTVPQITSRALSI